MRIVYSDYILCIRMRTSIKNSSFVLYTTMIVAHRTKCT